jgi:hypothetical protein
MKRLKNLMALFALSAIVLTSCYKEGPKISFRAKRDRIANEWVVTDYSVGGKAAPNMKDSFYIGDSLTLVFNMARGGYYNLDLQFTKEYSEKNGGRLFNLSSNFYTKEIIILKGNLANNNAFNKKIGSSGRWSFTDKFKKIEMGNLGNGDLSKADDKQTTIAEILMLKNKKMKLQMDIDGESHTITFEPLNDEIVK